MNNISDDRIKELREWLTSLTSGSDDDIRADLLSILDDYASLRAENELLRKDNNYFHAGFDSVREDYEEQKARAEKVEDKLAEVTKLWSTAERDATHLYARMMKAEAELDEEKGRSASLGREIDRLHAALALREEK